MGWAGRWALACQVDGDPAAEQADGSVAHRPAVQEEPVCPAKQQRNIQCKTAAALVPVEKPKRTEEQRRARPRARGPPLSRGFPRLLGLCAVFFPLWNKISR